MKFTGELNCSDRGSIADEPYTHVGVYVYRERVENLAPTSSSPGLLLQRFFSLLVYVVFVLLYDPGPKRSYLRASAEKYEYWLSSI